MVIYPHTNKHKNKTTVQYVYYFISAYNLKHARDLIRAISKKVKAPQNRWLAELQSTSAAALGACTGSRSDTDLGPSSQRNTNVLGSSLPPILPLSSNVIARS